MNGSGDYVIAFFTAPELRILENSKFYIPRLLKNKNMTSLFEAVIEATEEAIYNSILKAESITRNGHTVKALPVN